jgi:hypothetical protein
MFILYFDFQTTNILYFMGLKYNKRMSIVAAFCIDSIWQCLNSMLDVLKHKHMIVPFLGKPFHKLGPVLLKGKL